MLRRNAEPPRWWQRIFQQAQVPAYVLVRADDARHCPECASAYDPRDRYCPRCHTAVPEWRFG